MFDLESDYEKHSYGISSLAFGCFALALACAGAYHVVMLIALFDPGGRPAFLSSAWLGFGVSTGINLVCILGYYLVWHVSADAGWRRRSGMLIVMGMVDLGLWGIEYRPQIAKLLGFGEIAASQRHAWLLLQIGFGLGWVELMYVSGLAWSLLAHFHKLDHNPGDAIDKPAPVEYDWDSPVREMNIPYLNSMVGNGAMVLARAGMIEWIVLLVFFADWRHWPMNWLVANNMRHLFALLFLGLQAVYAIVLLKAAFLAFSASVFSRRKLRSLKIQETFPDALRSRSEEGF